MNARRGAEVIEIHLRSSMGTGPAYWRKSNFSLAAHRYAGLAILDDGRAPKLFLIPSLAWNTPDGVLVDRTYECAASAPEWGINLPGGRAALDRYALQKVLGGGSNEATGSTGDAPLQHQASRQPRPQLASGHGPWVDGRTRDSRESKPPHPTIDGVPAAAPTIETAVRALRAAAEELGGASPTSSWWQQSGRKPRYDQLVRIAAGGWADILALAGLPPSQRHHAPRPRKPAARATRRPVPRVRHSQPTGADALIELLLGGCTTTSEDERAPTSSEAARWTGEAPPPIPRPIARKTSTAARSFLSHQAVNAVPLFKLRAIAIEAVRSGANSHDAVYRGIEDRFKMQQGLSRAHERELRRLLSSAIGHGWLAVDENGDLSHVSTPGHGQNGGQLMRHSLGGIAHALTATLADTNDGELADAVVAHLGYTGRAGRTATKIVAHMVKDL